MSAIKRYFECDEGTILRTSILLTDPVTVPPFAIQDRGNPDKLARDAIRWRPYPRCAASNPANKAGSQLTPVHGGWRQKMCFTITHPPDGGEA